MQQNRGLELPGRDQADCELSVPALSHEILLELCCWAPRHVPMGFQDSVNSLIKWEWEGDRKYTPETDAGCAGNVVSENAEKVNRSVGLCSSLALASLLIL